MSDAFFEQPILNSPYDYPSRHWELDPTGQPTQRVAEARRIASFITPIPRARRQNARQARLDEGDGLSTTGQRYDPNPLINQLRERVDQWRKIPNPADWKVTPETARLLQHWRQHEFNGVRPFFCQVEAVETLIWLTEVAPHDARGKTFIDHLERANEDANPGLERIALKLATGAGKTTVMAMIIAWQTINAARRRQSKRFTNGFLVVTPGITIKDRLRVLQPNDPESYFTTRELVPSDMMPDLMRAKIVITNYHAFKLRERIQLAAGTRNLLKGRHGDDVLQTTESDGQMIQRVMPELMGLKNIMVLNDEAHHCYQEKPGPSEEIDLKGEDKKQAENDKEAARLWINGLKAVQGKLGLSQVVDLSATPFFLRGSGYAEGTLFPWTMSDFSLMDAIECGIVKLPRVPVDDNLGDQTPMYRNLWEHIKTKMPKKGRGSGGQLDPADLPTQLLTALDALYGHYANTFDEWQRSGITVPPCFIVVCNNTSTSKLVYDYISGFNRTHEDGSVTPIPGKLELFRNFDDQGTPYARPRSLLIDSEQLESGDALDPGFRAMAADEIDRFKREIRERTGDPQAAENIADSDLLREVMNTVGKHGKLGEQIRCVVSVSMLTEGWDTNTVTHVLGVRAFGTQLLCEQVIGRALRRQSYELTDGLFEVEYADVLGIPFDFTAKPVVVKPQKPRETVQVRAVRPDRDAQEITFPRVAGYRVDLPGERLRAEFTPESRLRLTPELVGATETRNSGIIGQPVDLTLARQADIRHSQVVYELTSYLVMNKWRSPDGEPQLSHFGQLKRITSEWVKDCLDCVGGTYPAQLKYKMLSEMAADKIIAAITRAHSDTKHIRAVLDAYNPSGSTRFVNFSTSKLDRYQTDSRRCHVNWVVLDSGWEAEFCRVVEGHPRVRSYVKNHGLGLEVPYLFGGEPRIYLPDFIVRLDDGHGEDDVLNLVVEIKGYRKEDAIIKKETMETRWVPGVNNLGTFGRWAFAEFTDVYAMQADFADRVDAELNRIIETASAPVGV